ncbi:MAG: alpha/beta fold hydrolase, partial [Dehalococcoidia bacterium]
MSAVARTVLCEGTDVRIACTVRGEGPPVVLLPSLGRGADDFDDLSRRLAEAGFTAVAMDCRGVGESTGTTDRLTLHDYASDVALVIERVAGAPAHVVGHAFGNRVARCVAADHPALVRSVTLLAAGGQVEPDAEAWRALARVFR